MPTEEDWQRWQRWQSAANALARAEHASSPTAAAAAAIAGLAYAIIYAADRLGQPASAGADSLPEDEGQCAAFQRYWIGPEPGDTLTVRCRYRAGHDGPHHGHHPERGPLDWTHEPEPTPEAHHAAGIPTEEPADRCESRTSIADPHDRQRLHHLQCDQPAGHPGRHTAPHPSDPLRYVPWEDNPEQPKESTVA